MTPKYEITDIKHPGNPQLFRIRALRNIPRVNAKAGDLGGYIEKESNLSQEGDCWISDDSVVYKNAQVSGDAHIFEHSYVFENAKVCENARIFNKVWVYGNASVSGNAQVYGDTWVSGDAIINEGMIIFGKGRIILTSSAQIYYADGVTAYFNLNGELTVNGSSPDIEHHKMLARLKLS